MLALVISAYLCFISISSVNGVCTTEDLRSYNYLLTPWLANSIEVDGDSGVPKASLDNLDRSRDARFKFELKFHKCTDRNLDFISVRSQNIIDGKQYYLANTGDDNVADLVEDRGESFSNSLDQRLFAYIGGREVDATHLESRQKFLASGPSLSVVYMPRNFTWAAWPFITRINSTAVETTQLSVTFKIDRQDIRAAVYLNSHNRIAVLPSTSHSYRWLTSHDLQFEYITWGLYQGFDANGDIVHGQAVVLKEPRTMNYISPLTNDGNINLRYNLCNRRKGKCLRFSTINLQYYNDVRRSQNSIFSTPDIRNQNVVDERFFELIRLPNGLVRFRSIINPDKYLAVIRLSHSRYHLAIAEFEPNLPETVQYSFNAPIRRLSGVVMTLPRLPCGADTLRVRHAQRHLFQCL